MLDPCYPASCPSCAASLAGPAIPAEYLASNRAGVTHYPRVLARYNAEAKRTTQWECPDCGALWPSEGIR